MSIFCGRLFGDNFANYVGSAKILVAMVHKVVAAWRVDSASISLRKCKTKGKTYTAGDLKLDDYVDK